MRRRWMSLVVLVMLTATALRGAEPAKAFVQKQPFNGPYTLIGQTWWFEANTLAGAIGLRPGDIKASRVADQMQIVFRGKTFLVPVRKVDDKIFLDAEVFVRGLGGTFRYLPASQRIEIDVPLATANTPVNVPPQPTAHPSTTPAPANAPKLTFDAFQLQVGANSPSGIPYRVHVDMTNPTSQSQSVVLRVVEGDNTLNEQGPVDLAPGKHPQEWVFYSQLQTTGNTKVVMLVNGKETASRTVDQGAPGNPNTPATPEPTSTNPPGF